jgi:hypothetical protein
VNKPDDLLAEFVSIAREAVDEIMKDMEELGFVPTKLKQEELRARFMEIANTVDINEYVMGRDAFVAEFGQNEWDKQAKLARERQENGR